MRSVEVGSVMLGKHDAATGRETPAAMDLVRLAHPRRMYTQSHVDFVGEVVRDIFERRKLLPGIRIVEQPAVLRHFTATFEPVPG